MADPLTAPAPMETDQQAPERPMNWTDVEQSPDYQNKTPDKQIVMFSRWHDAAYNYASQQPGWNDTKEAFNTKMANMEQQMAYKARAYSNGDSPEMARFKELAGVAVPMRPDEARYNIAQEQKTQNPDAPLAPDLQAALDKGKPDASFLRHSSLGALASQAGRQLIPTAAGLKGAAVGAGIAAAIPVVGETGIAELIGGLIGFGVASWGAGKVQNSIVNNVAPNSLFSSKTEQEQAAEHPWATELGGLLAFGRPNPAKLVRSIPAMTELARGAITLTRNDTIKALTDLSKLGADKFAQEYADRPQLQRDVYNVFHIVSAGGGNALFNAADQLRDGHLSATELLKAAGEGALFNEPWMNAVSPSTKAMRAAREQVRQNNEQQAAQVEATATPESKQEAIFYKQQADKMRAAGMHQMADVFDKRAHDALRPAVEQVTAPATSDLTKLSDQDLTLRAGDQTLPEADRQAANAEVTRRAPAIQRISDEELNNRQLEVEDALNRARETNAPETAQWTKIQEALATEKRRRQTPATEPATEGTPTSEKAPATITPEQQIERNRIDQNINETKARIVNEARAQAISEGVPSAARAGRIEEIINQERQVASVSAGGGTDQAKVIREAYRQAHEEITKQAGPEPRAARYQPVEPETSLYERAPMAKQEIGAAQREPIEIKNPDEEHPAGSKMEGPVITEGGKEFMDENGKPVPQVGNTHAEVLVHVMESDIPFETKERFLEAYGKDNEHQFLVRKPDGTAALADRVKGQSLMGTEKPLQSEALNQLRTQEIGAAQREPTEKDLWGKAGKFVTDEQKAGVADAFVNRVTDIFKNFKVQRTVSEAKKGAFLKGWYKSLGDWMLDLMGPETPRFARLFAAFGANNAPVENTVRALNTWNTWVERGRPNDAASIDKILEDTIITETGRAKGRTAKDIMAWGNNVKRVLMAADPSKVKLSGPKVDPYAANFLGDLDRTTLDRHMGIPYALQQGMSLNEAMVKGSTIFGRRIEKTPEGGALGKQGFPGMAYEAHLRHAAQILSERTGEKWAAANVQEAIWGYYQPLKALSEEMGVGLDDLLKGKVKYDQSRLNELRSQIQPQEILNHPKVQAELARIAESGAAGGRERGVASTATAGERPEQSVGAGVSAEPGAVSEAGRQQPATEIGAAAREAGWQPAEKPREHDKPIQDLLESTFPQLFKGPDPLYKLNASDSTKGGHIWVNADGSPNIFFDSDNFSKELAKQVKGGRAPEEFAKAALTEELVHKFTGVEHDEAKRLGKELIDANPKLARDIAERYYSGMKGAAKERAMSRMLSNHGTFYYEAVYDNALAISKGENRDDIFRAMPKTFIDHIIAVVKNIMVQLRGKKDFESMSPAMQEKVQTAIKGMQDLDKAYENRFNEPSPLKEDLANAPRLGAAQSEYASQGREVSAEEFSAIKERGRQQIAGMEKKGQETTGLQGDTWTKVKDNAFTESQKSWGGVTIDPRTGKAFQPEKAESGPFAVTAKREGQESIRVPEKASREEFEKAMEQAKKQFPQLASADHYLGVFHDDKLGTIDIDPVIISKTAAQAEEIGAHTKAVGGAYDYATGNGLFPPQVKGPAVVKRDIGPNDQHTNIPSDERLKEILTGEGKDVSGNVKAEKVGAHRDIPAGTHIGVRIDIPAFKRSGDYAQTIHDVNRSGGISHVLGYDGIVIIDNPTFYVSSEKAAQKIQAGGNKFPLATADGKYNPAREIPKDINDWTPVGFDPKEHSFFYDKRTDEKVTGGDQAIMVGNTAFVKNPVYGDRSKALFAASREGEKTPDINEYAKLLGLSEQQATAAVGSQATGGIAQRVAEARGVNVAPGSVEETDQLTKRGYERLAAGEKAEEVAARLKATKQPASSEDFGLFRARLQDLQKESNTRGAITPEEIEFFKTIKPFQTQWSEQGRAMQRDTDLDTGTLLGIERGVAEAQGRAMKPVEKQAAAKIVKDTETARGKQTASEDALQKGIADMAPKKTKLSTDRDSLAKIIKGFYPDEGVHAPTRTTVTSALPPDVKAAIWKYAKENYMTGDTWLTLAQVEKAVGADLGMPPSHVREIIAEPKTLRKLSDDAYAAQAQQRMIVQEARSWMKSLDRDPVANNAVKAWDTLRSIVTLGHANAPITHAGRLVFIPDTWGQFMPSVRLGFRLLAGDAYGANSLATYEGMMREVAEHDQYGAWTRAGLASKVGAEDEVATYLRSGFLGKLGVRGNMAMSVLKWLRMQRMEAEMNKLSPELRKDPEVVQRMAGLINNETGILSANTKLAQAARALQPALFAGQLEGSRWKNVIMNPIEAARLYAKGGGATDAEKVFRSYVIKQNAKLVAPFFAALGVNAFLNKSFGSGDPEDQINFLDPTRSDWLAFKWNGQTIIAPSNFLAPLRLTLATVSAPFIKGARNDIGDRLKNYALGKMHPGFTDVKELIEGKEAYTDRPLPWVPANGKKPALAWYEYLASKGPIPIAQAVHDTAQALIEQGVDGDMAKVITAASIGATSGLLGVHAHETQLPKGKHQVPWDIFTDEKQGQF